VGNALKFTERGCVTVTVKPSSREGVPANLLELAVIDTGIGIPLEKRAAIFEKFVQAEASTTRRFGGTGLGLSIVQQLVGAMGGEITVQDTCGGGSTFVVAVALPGCEPAGEVAPTPVVPARLLGGGPVRRVLLAEDDVVNRKLVTRLLERLGCQVHGVGTGTAVVEAVRAATTHFDLILMDIEMPELDGYGATAAVRRLEASAGHRTPIVALTAHVMPETRAKCVAADMDGYLAKPLAQNELVSTLEQWCRARAAA